MTDKTRALREALTPQVHAQSEAAWDAVYAAAMETGRHGGQTRALIIAHDAWRSVIVRAVAASLGVSDE